MKDLNLVGFVKRESVEKVLGTFDWEVKEFDLPPFEVVTPSPGYMLTLGSGNASGATVAYGFQYNAAIDVVRHDFNSPSSDEPLINIDHFIAGSISRDQFAIFQTPPQQYHWLKPNDPIIGRMSRPWQETIGAMLRKRREQL